MTGTCLFSAPYDFLPEQTIKAYERVLPTVFREIWKIEDLRPEPLITAWVPNPGQNFVIDGDVLRHFPALRVIVTPSTGRNHIDNEACERLGIAVYSLLDVRETLDSISASSEFSFLLLLNTLRRLDVGVREVSDGRWRQREDEMRGRELDSLQVGLVGFGRIGHRLARYCQAFGAKVAYYDPYVSSDDLPYWPLEDIFDNSDVVVICCSLTTETTGMIDGHLLSRLKHGASFINSSRGELVVEADLVEALSTRPDLRVGLDVLAGEVTDTHHDSPLLGFHRRGQIVITPHIAGATIESQSKAALGALSALSWFTEGTYKDKASTIPLTG